MTPYHWGLFIGGLLWGGVFSLILDRWIFKRVIKRRPLGIVLSCLGAWMLVALTAMNDPIDDAIFAATAYAVALVIICGLRLWRHSRGVKNSDQGLNDIFR